MNERIKLLAEQAGFDIEEDGHIMLHHVYLTNRMKTFAELIVKECVEQSMSIGRYNTPSGITPDLSIAIAVGLKKHFGVEE